MTRCFALVAVLFLLALPAEAQPPYPSLYATHGYNFDFDEGSWGARGFFPLPLDAPVGIGGGVDHFPEDEFRSLTVVGVDATYGARMDLLGRGNAYGGLGPRLYRSTFDSKGASQSNTDWGFGLTLGASVPVGPVSIYGDIGTDRVYDEWNCYTRVGIGLEFGTVPE